MNRFSSLALLCLVPVAIIASCAGSRDAGFADAETEPVREGPEFVSAGPVPPPIALGTRGDPYELALSVALPAPAPLETAGLYNVFHLGDNIVSGSEPHGEASYQALADLGIRTILSVDGKSPNVEAAARHGMRYVHVPIRYRGIGDEELVKIAKTFRETEGPFYIHCFHGRHRGPAAAAVGRLVLDGADRHVALAEMRQWCGTASKYGGLYRDIAVRPMPSAEETAALDWNFPGRVEMKGFRHAMIAIVRSSDALKDLQKRGWKMDPEHPDVDPVNEADKLADLFERSLELDEVKNGPEDQLGWTRDAARESRELHRLLRVRDEVKPGKIDAAFRNVKRSCIACHREYRND